MDCSQCSHFCVNALNHWWSWMKCTASSSNEAQNKVRRKKNYALILMAVTVCQLQLQFGLVVPKHMVQLYQQTSRYKQNNERESNHCIALQRKQFTFCSEQLQHSLIENLYRCSVANEIYNEHFILSASSSHITNILLHWM